MIAQLLAQHSHPSNYHPHSLVENYSRPVSADCSHPVVEVIIMMVPINVIVISMNEIFIRLVAIRAEVVDIKGSSVNHVPIAKPIATILACLSAMDTDVIRALIALINVIITCWLPTALTRSGFCGGTIIKDFARLFSDLLAMAEPTLSVLMERAIISIMAFVSSTLLAFRHVASPRTLAERYVVHEG